MKTMTGLAAAILAATFITPLDAADSQWQRACTRRDDLRLEVYITAGHVQQLATGEAARERAWKAMRELGITKAYVEVYCSGLVVPKAHLVLVRDWLRGRGVDVAGGICTAPGGNFGVAQTGKLKWFNWQNKKTQHDVRQVIRSAAPVFDAMIVDDFFCTDDQSPESRAAKGARSWGEYRRALMTDMARSVIVGPAKEAHPGITMIVKYPQWYDRFHQFGYDTVTLPRIFDRVWVGTETRGRLTQRYGFVQPYEGFVNYRWLAGIAPNKIGGAWFDYGDCHAHDFLDQVYTSVLAGARELIFYSLAQVVAGHPDHRAIVAQFDRLADLAATVRHCPVTGIPAYKPPNSDPAGDMYLMDFLGMLGIPIVPVAQFPETASVILLPAQAAADPDLLTRVKQARARGTRLIVTASLLSRARVGAPLAAMAGLTGKVQSKPLRVHLPAPPPKLGGREGAATTVDLESPLQLDRPRAGDIVGTARGRSYALLIAHAAADHRMAVLNTHTFCQADFDAVGEALLCPRPLGLLTLKGPPLRALRAAFRGPGDLVLDGPSCVTLHPLAGCGTGSCVVQNFNEQPARMTLTVAPATANPVRFQDAFSNQPINAHVDASGSRVTLTETVPARGRVWIQPVARNGQ